MSAVFGETLRFGQPDGPDIQRVVTSDEFHSRQETLGGYPGVYDMRVADLAPMEVGTLNKWSSELLPAS
jgi:hypothetical protein